MFSKLVIHVVMKEWIMRLLRKWKQINWFLIVAFLTYLVIVRVPALLSGNPTNMDIIVFIIWTALIIAPMFREVNIFGVGLKNDIDSLRNDFRGEMLNLRSEIQNTINFSPQINVGQPPADSELPGLREAIQKAFKDTFGTEELPVAEIEEELSTPIDTQFLFSVRYNMDNELNRIWRSLSPIETEDRLSRSSVQIMRQLLQSETIDMEFYKAFRDVYTVCNQAIHGQDVSQAKINFVRDVAPQLLAYLGILPISQQKADI